MALGNSIEIAQKNPYLNDASPIYYLHWLVWWQSWSIGSKGEKNSDPCWKQGKEIYDTIRLTHCLIHTTEATCLLP